MATAPIEVQDVQPDPSRKLAYGLRTCNEDLTSWGGFQWPESGHVVAPDWKPTAGCGYGLHMLHEGQGDGSYLDWSPEAKWLCIAYYEDSAVDLSGKHKVPEAWVMHVGDRLSATMALAAYGYAHGIVGGTATAGDYGTATAGYRGTATAGDYGTATAGDYGTATAGDRGTATAGDYGTATAGDYGTATAGYRGTATAGDRGIIVIRHYDRDAGRYRIKEGYIGGNGLKPNTPYRLNDAAELVEAA